MSTELEVSLYYFLRYCLDDVIYIEKENKLFWANEDRYDFKYRNLDFSSDIRRIFNS